jgi:MFS family permease
MAYQSNIWKMYLFTFLTGMHFFGAVLVPFFTQWGKISFAQIMILQSWFMLCIFILEVPTGAVADYLGRKVSLALACIFTIAAAITYTRAPIFWMFMLGEFFFALSAALISGADEALLYDTLKKTKQQKQSKKIFARFESIHLIGIMVATPIGSVMAKYYGLTAPMIYIWIPSLLAFILALTLKEPSSDQKQVRESKRYIAIIKEGFSYFRNHKILRILALDMILINFIAYFMIWLYQPMLMKAGVDIAYFGIVHALFVMSQIIIMNNFGFLERLFGSKRSVLFFSALILGVMFLVAGIYTILPIVLIAILIGGGFGLGRNPLFSNYMNKYIPSSKRATVLSSVSMMNRIALIIFNPIIGFLVDQSLSITMILLGVLGIVFAFISRVKEEHLID